MTAPDGMIPFTSVDELGAYFDGRGEPNNIHLEAAIGGHLDQDRLRASVRDTLAAHPRARVRRAPVRRWDRRLFWEIVPEPDVEPVDHVSWCDDGELAACRRQLMSAAPAVDLAPPLRMRHAIGPEGDVLILNAHHSALDGRSCLSLLRTIANRYAGRPDPVPDEPSPVRIPAPTAMPAGRIGARFRRPARIIADHPRARPGYGFYPLTLRLVSDRSRATPEPIGTINDVLLTALALTIARWNADHAGGAIKITMPIDARSQLDRDRLGNLSRLAVIVGDGEASADPHRLLASIARQTGEAKRRGGAQVDLVSRALVAAGLPVAAKQALVRAARRTGAAWFSDTSLLSNLGRAPDPFDFGAAFPVTGLWFSTPAPMPRGLSVGAVTLHGLLRLCFRFRYALFDDPAAERFAVLFADVLAAIGDPRIVDVVANDPPQPRPASPGDWHATEPRP